MQPTFRFSRRPRAPHAARSPWSGLGRRALGTASGFLSLGMLASVGSVAGCSPKAIGPMEIERFAFVPAGQVQKGGVTIGSSEPLLVDRFEVTRNEWAAFQAKSTLTVSPHEGADLEGPINPEWPAVGMDFGEARQFAQSREMRLPTVREWLWIAGGTRAMRYPYGTNEVESAANTLGLSLEEPTSVGTFPNGQTPGTGIYDMQGNAAEWAHRGDWLGTTWLPYEGLGSRMSAPGAGPELAWAMGGSFMTHGRPLYRFGGKTVLVNAREKSPGYRSSDLGVRCVVSARDWLERNASNPLDAGERNRLRLVGAKWGASAIALLEDLREDYPKSRWIEALWQGARGR